MMIQHASLHAVTEQLLQLYINANIRSIQIADYVLKLVYISLAHACAR
jgi:hypothetical protein